VTQNAKRRVGRIRLEKLAIAGEVCAWLDITKPYFDTLARGGVIEQAKTRDGQIVRGRYNLKDCVRRYLGFLLSRTKEKPASAKELDRWKVTKLRAEARTAELDYDLALHNTYPKETVEQGVALMCAQLRGYWEGLPAHVSPLLVGKENTQEVYDILAREVRGWWERLFIPSPEQLAAPDKKTREYWRFLAEREQQANGNGNGHTPAEVAPDD
jgi:hypothetical protein